MTKVEKLLLEIKGLQDQVNKIQDKCKHTKITGVYGCNTGNYDPANDKYWIDVTCKTCRKQWAVFDDDPDSQYYEILNRAEMIKND